MVDHLNDAIKLLLEHRKGLVEQLGAIDTAIAALGGPERQPRPVVTPPPAPAGPRRRKRVFALTEEHKRKLVEGRKRARQAREAKQTASQESAPLISAWKADGPPRLVRPESEHGAHPDGDMVHVDPSIVA